MSENIFAKTIDGIEDDVEKEMGWGLSTRLRNGLRNAGVRNLGDLVMKSEKDLLKFKNFGRKTLNELKGILKMYGLELKGQTWPKVRFKRP